MATIAIQQAILTAADRCVQAFAVDLENHAEEEVRNLRSDLHKRVLGALTRETGVAVP
jgi:hypothetical protein